MKTFTKIAVTSVAIVGLMGSGVGVIYAASSTAKTGNPFSNLVSAIATKFNLNASDVQKVFDEQQQQMAAQRQATEQQRMKTMLDKAVTAGKLTQAQEDLIVAKQTEVKTFTESLTGKSATDRQAAMKTEMASLKTWATDNKIPAQYAMFGGGPGMGLGRGGMGMGFGPRGHSGPPASEFGPAPTGTSATLNVPAAVPTP